MSRRVCWKMVPKKCSLADIKKGDLYQLDRGDEKDPHDPSQLFLAMGDAYKSKDGSDRNEVEAIRLVEDPTFVDDEKFTEAMNYRTTGAG